MNNYSLCTLTNEDSNSFKETELRDYISSLCNQRLSLDDMVRQMTLLKQIENHQTLTPDELSKCLLTISIDAECWRPVVKYEQYLLVSSYGRVKSLRSNRIVRLQIHNGYTNFTSTYSSSKCVTLWVHRLVAEAFIPKTEEDIRLGRAYVNHKDGNKINNRVENLEWCTNQENVQHAFNTGLAHAKRGIEAHRAKIDSLEDIEKLKQAYYDGNSAKDVGLMFGITPTEVLNIVKGKRFVDLFDEDYHRVSQANRIVENKQHGLNHPRCKLTPDILNSVCLEYKSGITTKELAKRYGVSVSTMRNWLHKSWGANLPIAVQCEFGHSNVKATPDNLRLVGKLKAEHHLLHEISDIIGVKYATVESWFRKPWAMKYITEGYNLANINRKESNE